MSWLEWLNHTFQNTYSHTGSTSKSPGDFFDKIEKHRPHPRLTKLDRRVEPENLKIWKFPGDSDKVPGTGTFPVQGLNFVTSESS